MLKEGVPHQISENVGALDRKIAEPHKNLLLSETCSLVMTSRKELQEIPESWPSQLPKRVFERMRIVAEGVR